MTVSVYEHEELVTGSSCTFASGCSSHFVSGRGFACSIELLYLKQWYIEYSSLYPMVSGYMLNTVLKYFNREQLPVTARHIESIIRISEAHANHVNMNMVIHMLARIEYARSTHMYYDNSGDVCRRVHYTAINGRRICANPLLLWNY